MQDMLSDLSNPASPTPRLDAYAVVQPPRNRVALRARGLSLAATLAIALSACGGGSGGGTAASSVAASPPAAEQPATEAPDTSTNPPGALTQRALVIDLDGATYAAVQSGIAAGTLPHLARLQTRLAYSGGVAGTPNQQPTLDTPGWATLLTGTWANRHQVMSEAPKQALRGTTVFQAARGRNAGASAAAVASPGLAQLLASEADSGSLDAIADCARDAAATDCVTAKAVQWIGGGYALVFAQYRAVKDAALAYGTGSSQYAGTLARLDQAVGKLVAATSERTDGRWLVIVTGNHGLSDQGQDDGLPLLPESSTFLALNQAANMGSQGVGAALPRDFAELYANASIADVAPTVLGHLGALPGPAAYLMDGSPLTGAQAVSQLTASAVNDRSANVAVALNWTAPAAADGTVTVLRDGEVIARALPAATASYTDTGLPGILNERGTYRFTYTVQVGEGSNAALRAVMSPALSFVPPVPLAATLKNGLAAYYPFSATLPPVDLTGNSTMGPAAADLPSAAGVVVPGPFEGSHGLLVDDSQVTTDGIEGYRLTPRDSSVNVAAGATPRFTIGFWFKTNSCIPSNNGVILANKDYVSGGNAGVAIGMFPGASASQCAVAFNIGSGSGVRADGPTSPYTPIARNRWVYIAFAVDGVSKLMNMYVYDPVTDAINRVAAGKSTGSVDVSKLAPYPHWGIGDDGSGKFLMSKCNGSVTPPYTAGKCATAATSDHQFADLAMWNRVLTDAELSSIFLSHQPLSTLGFN